MRLRSALVLGALLLAAGSAEAQFNQYVAPGEFDIERESRQEELDQAIQEARWRLGRFYLNPWISLRDIAYIDNVNRAQAGEPKQSDVTLKAGAGIQGYAPVGSEVTFAFHLLPEYIWWNDLSGRNGWNGHYGAGFFGDLGRTGFEATVARVEDTVFLSRELEVPVDLTEERLDLKLEIELFGPVNLALGGYGRRLEYADDPNIGGPAGLTVLNRDETVYEAGLKFDLGRGFDLGVGAQFSEADFEVELFDRSNDGISPIVQLDYSGGRVNFRSDLAFRDLEPTEELSGFVPYDETTGSAQLAWVPTGRSEIQLFWNRNLVYTQAVRWSYFTDSGVGGALLLSLGNSASVRLFYETGDNEYIQFGTGINDRTDDLDAWGGNFKFNLGPLVLNLGYTQTDYTSNLPEFDRDISVVRAGLTFRGSRGFPWT